MEGGALPSGLPAEGGGRLLHPGETASMEVSVKSWRCGRPLGGGVPG